MFLARDVAEWIEHNKPNEMIKNVDEDEKQKIKINHGDSNARVLQNNTEYWFFTEDGLYKLRATLLTKKAKVLNKHIRSKKLIGTLFLAGQNRFLIMCILLVEIKNIAPIYNVYNG